MQQLVTARRGRVLPGSALSCCKARRLLQGTQAVAMHVDTSIGASVYQGSARLNPQSPAAAHDQHATISMRHVAVPAAAVGSCPRTAVKEHMGPA